VAKELGDLLVEYVRKIVKAVDFYVVRIQPFNRNSDYFFIRAAFVCHNEAADLTASDNRRRNNGIGEK